MLANELGQELHTQKGINAAHSNKEHKRYNSNLSDPFREVENTRSHGAGEKGKNGSSECTFSDGSKGSLEEGPLVHGLNGIIGQD